MLDGLTILIIVLLLIFIVLLIIWFFNKDKKKDKKEKFTYEAGIVRKLYSQSSLAVEANEAGGANVPYPGKIEWDGNPATEETSNGFFPRVGGFARDTSFALGGQLGYKLRDKDFRVTGKQKFLYKILATKEDGDLELIDRQDILQDVYNVFYSIQIFYENIHTWAKYVTNRVNNITDSKLPQIQNAIDRLEIYLWGNQQRPRANPRVGSGGNRDLEQKLIAYFGKQSGSGSNIPDFGYSDIKGISLIDGRCIRIYTNNDQYDVDNETADVYDRVIMFNLSQFNILNRLAEGRLICKIYSPVTNNDSNTNDPTDYQITNLRELGRQKSDNKGIFYRNNNKVASLLMISPDVDSTDVQTRDWVNKPVIFS